MQKIGATLNLSAGDLIGHLNCRYLTGLDLKVANGALEKPKIWDPILETLAERGKLHEQGFIDHVKAGGLSLAVIESVRGDRKAVAETTNWMGRGETIIVQSDLEDGGVG